MKNGGASTLDIVKNIKETLKRAAHMLPDGVDMKLLFDQSLFVRASIDGVLREALIAACLTAAMILLFLGNWRSTLIIAISIPLSILVRSSVRAPGRNDQHHDPGRAGAGRGYPGG